MKAEPTYIWKCDLAAFKRIKLTVAAETYAVDLS